VLWRSDKSTATEVPQHYKFPFRKSVIDSALEPAADDAQVVVQARRHDAQRGTQLMKKFERVIAMCDYSLEHYQSRPARQGEQYVSNRFPSGSIGFVVPGDQSVAVCMTCDTRLKLENIPVMMQTGLGLSPAETVTFVRIEGGFYHDGVRFENGRVLSLQELGPGITAWLEDALAAPLPHLDPQKQDALVAAQ
jgi:hypothetical protein